MSGDSRKTRVGKVVVEEGGSLAGGEQSIAIARVGRQSCPFGETEDNCGRVEKAAEEEGDIAGGRVALFVKGGLGERALLENGFGEHLAPKPGGGIAGVFSLAKIFDSDSEIAFGECRNCIGLRGEEFINGAVPGGIYAEESVGEMVSKVAPEHLLPDVHSDGDEKARGNVLEPATN